VAEPPRRIVWSESAVEEFQRLPDSRREHILRRVRLLAASPLMYRVEHSGRWAGLRRFHALGLIVYYTYWHQDETVYIEAIVPARSAGP